MLDLRSGYVGQTRQRGCVMPCQLCLLVMLRFALYTFTLLSHWHRRGGWIKCCTHSQHIFKCIFDVSRDVAVSPLSGTPEAVGFIKTVPSEPFPVGRRAF